MPYGKRSLTIMGCQGTMLSRARWIPARVRISSPNERKGLVSWHEQARDELGSGIDGGRVADGGAGHARGLDGAEHDQAAPARLGRAARVDGERLQPQLRGAADNGGRARRSLRAAQALRRRSRAVRRG